MDQPSTSTVPASIQQRFSVDRGRDPISDALNAGLQNEAPEARAARLEAEEHARLRSADIDKEISKARKSDFGKGARGLEDHKALDKAPKGSQGPSNAGKTTFLSQLRHQYDPEGLVNEKKAFKLAIVLTLVRSARALMEVASDQSGMSDHLEQVEELVALEDPLRKALGVVAAHTSAYPASFVLYSQQGEEDITRFDHAEVADVHVDSIMNTLATRRGSLKRLYETAQRKGLVSSDGLNEDSSEEAISLNASQRHFLRHLDQFTDDWTPSIDDILNCRIATLGAQECLLRINQKHWLRVVDPSGARGRRHVWIPYFDIARLCVFLIPLDYTEKVGEDSNRTVVHEAFELLNSIVANPLLANTDFVVFFNKMDILKGRLKSGKAPFRNYVKDFKKPAANFEDVRSYFRQKAEEAFNSRDDQRTLYIHWTQLTNVKTTKLTIAALQDSIIGKAFKESGFAL